MTLHELLPVFKELYYLYDYGDDWCVHISMIDKYFITPYELRDGGQADYRIYHFLSDMVLKNLYYQSGC